MSLQNLKNCKMVLSAVISFVVLVSLASAAPPEGESHHVQKRHILQMCELIATHTNRGCLDYNNYGCFCGLGNAASMHVDAVDGCCRVHDLCYGEVACFWMYPQFVGYSVDCTGEQCTCTDSPLFSPCAYTTCQCDLQFAQCLGRAEYNHSFSNYDRRECNRPTRRRRPRSQSDRSARKVWRDILREERRSLRRKRLV